MEIVQLIILSFVVEAVLETVKMLWEDDKLSKSRIGALIVGLVVAVAYNVDLIAMVGIPAQIDYIGVLLTGILISRGGNYIHDLVEQLNIRKDAHADA